MPDKATGEYSQDVVEFDLQQYWLVLRRNWLPASLTFLVCVGLAGFAAVYRNRPVYEANGQLLFQSRDPRSALTGVGQELSELEPVGRGNPLETQASILVSRSLLTEVIESLNLRNDEGELVSIDRIKRNLTVSRVPDADVLSVSFKSADRLFAARFVNELMQSYLAFSAKIQRSEAAAARRFIEEQLPRLKTEFEQASEALQEFKSANQIVSLDTEAVEISTLIADLNQRENTARIQLATAEANINSLRSQLQVDAAAALSLSTLNDSEGVQEVLTQLQNVETELTTQQTLYSSEHPTVANLQRKSDALNRLLQERVSGILGQQITVTPSSLQLGTLQQNLMSELVRAESERLALQTQINSLQALRNSYRTRASAFPRLEKRQRDLEQALTSSQARYERLLERLQELELAESQLQESNQVQIIGAAVVPEASVNRFNSKILLAGIGAGLLLAIAVAFALDLLDSTVRTVKQLEQKLGYPLLGKIPGYDVATRGPFLEQQGLASRVVVLSQVSDLAYKAYQRLHATLSLMNFHSKPRVLAVTSSIQGEGKSEISANLAAVMAAAGRRVLLVDADFRSPAQHHIWGLENRVGFSQILSDTTSLEAACHEVIPNLSVITSGAATADPLLMLESSQTHGFVQAASQTYDYVVFDSAAIVSVPDSLVLAKSCDGILFVARLKHIDHQSLAAAKSLLGEARLPVVGLVANQVDASQLDDSFAAGSKQPLAASDNRLGLTPPSS